jgi:hypothetical protein
MGDRFVEQQHNIETHNLGFIIMPAFRRDHELTGSEEALNVIVQAAESLARRYNSPINKIRSRNNQVYARYSFDGDKHFWVRIDSMMAS